MGLLTRQTLWSAAVLLFALWIVVEVITFRGNLVHMRVTTLALITGMLVVGLYIFSGTSGIISFGHVAFFAVGAYVSSWLTIPDAMRDLQFTGFPSDLPQVPLPLAVALAGLGAAGFAVVVGIPFLRLSGTTSAVATLALLLIVQIVASNWSGVTGGKQSVLGVPADVGITEALFGMVVAVLVAALYQISASSRRLRAAREDEVAAAAAGINVARERWVAFVVSAFVAGMSGAMWAHVVGPFGANSFSLELTFISVAMLIVGGMLSLTGAVVGVAVVTLLGEVPRQFMTLPVGSTPLIVSSAMLAILVLRPSGLIGEREVPLPSRWRRAKAGDWVRPSASLSTEDPRAHPCSRQRRGWFRRGKLEGEGR